MELEHPLPRPTLQRPLQVIRMPAQMTIQNAVELRNKLILLLSRNSVEDLVLELSSVSHIDASGVGALVDAFTFSLRTRHKFYLYNPTPEFERLIEEIDIPFFFPRIPSEAELFYRLPD